MGVSILKGKTLVKVENINNEELRFTLNNGEVYKLYHSQDCCEAVMIEDIEGRLEDLVGSRLLLAEETTSDKHPEGYVPTGHEESFTWTFYRFATVKGYVTVRWLGSSNGYYSESVDFAKL